MWINWELVEVDEFDKEPLCTDCHEDLSSRSTVEGIEVSCQNPGCKNRGKVAIRARSYAEIVQGILYRSVSE